MFFAGNFAGISSGEVVSFPPVGIVGWVGKVPFTLGVRV